MTYIELLENLHKYIAEFSNNNFKFFECISKLRSSIVDKNQIESYLSNKDESFLEQTNASLEMILEYCKKNDFCETINSEILETFASNIESIIQIVKKFEKASKTSTPDTGETFKVSVDDKVREIQEKFENFDSKFDELNKATNNHFDKVENDLQKSYSSMIINNISILGIFVAIVFAGISSVSIFSKISFNFNDFYIKSLFLLFLIVFFVYNLLLMLFYFIYKINKLNSIKEENQLIQFSEFFKPFFVMDYILLGITLLLFGASLIFK